MNRSQWRTNSEFTSLWQMKLLKPWLVASSRRAMARYPIGALLDMRTVPEGTRRADEALKTFEDRSRLPCSMYVPSNPLKSAGVNQAMPAPGGANFVGSFAVGVPPPIMSATSPITVVAHPFAAVG